MKFATCVALSFLCCLLVQEASAESDSQPTLPPFAHTLFCIQYPRDCDPTPARTFGSTSVDYLWRQLNFVQDWVNSIIIPKEADPKQVDAWSILPREGNCNDYAVTKRHLLLQAGWPASSLLLAEVTAASNGEHHLILIARGAGDSWVLDNLRSNVARLDEVRKDYIWKRIETPENPRLWTKSITGLLSIIGVPSGNGRQGQPGQRFFMRDRTKSATKS